MIKKTLIISLTLLFIITTATLSVCGEEETTIIEDNIEDVADLLGNQHSRNNVDIKEIVIIKNNNQIELQLKLIDNGEIIVSEDIYYIVALVTSEDEYEIGFFDNEFYAVNHLGEIQDAQYSGVGTDTLIMTFNLSNSDEEISEVMATTFEEGTTGFFMDVAPDFSDLIIDIAAPDEGEVNEKINFSAINFGGTAPFSYEWDFDDGTISDDESPSHYFDSEGDYEVTLTVTDDAGNIETATTIISITNPNNGNNGDNNGNNNGNGNDDDSDKNPDSALFIFIGLILVLVIGGIAVVIFVIRR